MAERAHVTSIEALDAFRSILVRYRERAGLVLEEIGAEVMRVRLWLENDRMLYWKKQISLRGQKLEEVKQAWFRGQLSTSAHASVSKADVRKATEALREAEGKLQLVKRWSQAFESRVDPLAKQPEKLRGLLGSDLPKALAYLKEVVNTLDDYADFAPSRAALTPPPGGEEDKDADREASP